jgi:hypothetical protein
MIKRWRTKMLSLILEKPRDDRGEYTGLLRAVILEVDSDGVAMIGNIIEGSREAMQECIVEYPEEITHVHMYHGENLAPEFLSVFEAAEALMIALELGRQVANKPRYYEEWDMSREDVEFPFHEFEKIHYDPR